MEFPEQPKSTYWTKEDREYYSTPRENYNFLYYVFSDNDFSNSLLKSVKFLHEEANPEFLYKHNQEKLIDFLSKSLIYFSHLKSYFYYSDKEIFDKERIDLELILYREYIENDVQIYYLDKAEDLYKVDDPDGHAVLYCLNTKEYWPN